MTTRQARYGTARTVGVARFLVVAVVIGLLSVPAGASTDRTVTVVFRGRYTDPPGTAGMDHLAANLSAARTSNRLFSIRVFGHSEREEAFDYIAGFEDRGCLIVVGHSRGGKAAVTLAREYLVPAGIDVDLLIQLDSVGWNDDRLPEGVKGVNYFQNETNPALRWMIQRSVEGSTKIKVEREYGDVPDDLVTHTTIDDPLFGFTEAHYRRHFGSYPDLHARINDDVEDACRQ